MPPNSTLMRKSHAFLVSCLLISSAIHESIHAQSLLDGIDAAPLVITPVSATFKDTRIINAQSNETPGKNVLHFVIAHRFGQINEGAYALWGLDNASMRMAFDYGITDPSSGRCCPKHLSKNLRGEHQMACVAAELRQQHARERHALLRSDGQWPEVE